MRVIDRRSACVALALGVSVLARSGAVANVGYGPVTVDDAVTLRPGVTETTLHLDYGGDASRWNRDLSYLRLPFDVRYGWREGLEIGFSGSYDSIRGANELDDAAGFGDPSFRVKYLLAPVSPRATGFSVEGDFGLSVDESIGTGGESYGLTAVATTPFRQGFGHVELGYRFRPGDEDLFRWGLAYDRPLWRRVRVVGEVYGGRGDVLGIEDDIVAQLGLKGRVDDSWDWRLAAGAGFGGGAPGYIVRLGTAKEFGDAAGSGEAGPGELTGPPPWAPLEKSHEGTRALDEGDPARAVILLREALDADPSLAAAWNNLGVALARLGRPGEAKGAFEKALERGGENADILINLGYVLHQAGDHTGARLALARALALDPSRADARAALAALSPVPASPAAVP